jgi:hypothetical protein
VIIVPCLELLRIYVLDVWDEPYDYLVLCHTMLLPVGTAIPSPAALHSPSVILASASFALLLALQVLY